MSKLPEVRDPFSVVNLEIKLQIRLRGAEEGMKDPPMRTINPRSNAEAFHCSRFLSQVGHRLKLIYVLERRTRMCSLGSVGGETGILKLDDLLRLRKYGRLDETGLGWCVRANDA